MLWAALALIVAGLLWPQLLPGLLSSDGFMPHGHCYLWTPWLVRLNVATDAAIGLAYVSISVTLSYLVWKARQDIPFEWMFLAFGMFIVACGLTHFMEVWNVWHASYWAAGYVKLVTAVASLATAILLPGLIPDALELGRSARKSRERGVELERLGEELRKSNHDLEAFSYSAAHDLRGPLRRIKGFSELAARDKAMSDAAREHLRQVEKEAADMAGLIDKLLASARVSSAQVERREVDVSGLCLRLLDALRRDGPQRAVEAAVAEGLRARADSRLLEIALGNLLSNAWKFTRKTAGARIEVGTRGGEFFVRDNGAGFPPQDAPKLFKPFQRLHSGAEFEGTGIGLSMVARIIEKHGGAIRAEAQPGEGATFYFTLGPG